MAFGSIACQEPICFNAAEEFLSKLTACQQELKGTAAEGVVSFADLIAMGGAYAVAITGGPSIEVNIGMQI